MISVKDHSQTVLRTEDEIMNRWGGKTDPVVSICCLTYNHEPYIEDALKGFLIQETDFPFEIIVHDDASTDRTADTIRDYHARYPRLIRPILQTENQYSQRVKITASIMIPRAQGEFIALCEGDDYWTAADKLARQVEFLSRHPTVKFSFHPAIVLDSLSPRTQSFRSYLKTGDRIIPPEEIIMQGGGFCPTASRIYRRNALTALPQWYYTDTPVSDQFLIIIGAVPAGAAYLDVPMSVYRRGVDGSWTRKMRGFEYAIEHDRKRVYCLSRLNEDLETVYNRQFGYQIAKWSLHAAILCANQGDRRFRFWIEQSWNAYPRMQTTQKVLYMARRAPWLCRLIVSSHRVVWSFARRLRRRLVVASQNNSR